MELNHDNARRRRSEEEDRLSLLPDDVLLSILDRVGDLTTAVRTTVLSTRWKRLPWLLSYLHIDVEDFMSDPHSEPNEANVIHDAMLNITAVTKSFFGRESIVTRLQLKLFLIDTLSCGIGPVVCDAIDRGLLKELDLAILDEKKPFECSVLDMLKRSQDMVGFFGAYPSVLHCLTTLSLYSLRFVEVDLNHILFDCCKQLKHLTLSVCDAGPDSRWNIDAPNSKLHVLELNSCSFERIELISLPKLEKIQCIYWISNSAPLSLSFVPSLVELDLSHFLYPDQHLIKLSEVLPGAAGIDILTLDFMGNAIWLQSEIKQLASAFRKLRKLFILGVFVEFDLLWIIAFLEAAHSVEILYIEVFEPCEMEHVHSSDFPDFNRTNPQWELDFRGSRNLILRELCISNFRPLEQQLTFIRRILERAPNLQTVVLVKYDEECKECVTKALNAQPRAPAWPAFPKNKEEQDMLVKRVTDGTSFSGEVIFE